MAGPGLQLQVVEPDARALMLFTPEQQAFLEALTEVGTEREAIAAAGIDRKTLRQWKQAPAFLEALGDAEADYTERLVGKLNSAVVGAAPDELLNHPNAAFFLVKARDQRYRDNATVNIDNRQQTVNILTDAQAEAVARALAGVPEGEEIV